jgi:hypothetical protein
MKRPITAILFLLASSPLLAESQSAFFEFDRYSVEVGETISLPIRYSVFPSETALTGLGVQVHFDSTVLAYTGTTNYIQTPYAIDLQSDIDSNDDGDIRTDSLLNVLLVSLDKQFLPQPEDILFEISFEVLPSFPAGDGSSVTTTPSATAVGFDFVRGSTTIQIQRIADFDFADLVDVSPGTVQVSDPISVSSLGSALVGLEGRVVNGEASINGGEFQSGALTVNSGDQVRVRHTSATGGLESVTTTLIIDGVRGGFSSTTAVVDGIFGDRFEDDGRATDSEAD